MTDSLGAIRDHVEGHQKMRFNYPRTRGAFKVSAVLIGGLVLFATLGATGNSQAAVRAAASSGTPSVAASCTAITDYHNGSPLFSYVPGNGNFNLYFDKSGSSSTFCARTDSRGNLQIYDSNNSGMCLALDAAAGIIHEATSVACADHPSYTEWTAIPQDVVNGPANVYLLLNQYLLPNGQSDCMYENTQRPAIYATCSYSNEFEWILWPSLS